MPSLFATLKQHLDIGHPSQEPCDKTLDVRATTSFTSRCPGKPVGREFEEKKILIRDVHGQEGSFNFEKQGFSVMTLLDSNMSYEDFDDRAKVRAIYYREVEKALQQHLGADRVYFFGANIRKRLPSFPFTANSLVASQAEGFLGVSAKKARKIPSADLERLWTHVAHSQPSQHVHLDATYDKLFLCIGDIHGSVEKALKGRYLNVTVWKPLKGPVQDWPLAVCAADSVDVADLSMHTVVRADFGTIESIVVHHNKKQEWYYLSNQLPSELWVFRQVDSQHKIGNGVPHTAFSNPFAPKDAPARESINVRAIVYFKK